MVVALIIGAPAALGQEAPSPEVRWVERENRANLMDESVESVLWEEQIAPGVVRRWVFTTGYVTEANGATRFATYKYRADWPEQGEMLQVAERFYPETVPGSPEAHKATGIAVDDNGNVYVTGQSIAGGDGLNYITVAYNADLVPLAAWTDVGFGAGARRYSGPVVGGSDIPTDIGVNPAGQAVVVTGTSPGIDTGLDIATVAYDATNGGPPLPAWPDIGWGDGVRRYNYNLINGDDRAVELGGIIVVEELLGTIGLLDVIVLGTSWGGPTQDDYVTMRWGGTGGVLVWAQRYNVNELRPDVATGLWVEGSNIYCTGYAPPPSTSAAMSFGAGAMSASSSSGPLNYQYTTVSYAYGDGTLRWEHQWDYAGEDDYAADVVAFTVPGVPFQYVGVTGRARPAPGGAFDAGTIVLREEPGWVSLAFAHGFNGASGADDQGAAITAAVGDVFVAGMSDAATLGNMNGLTLKYRWTGLATPWEFHWGVYYVGTWGWDEWRDLVAARSGDPIRINVYPTGSSFRTGQSQDYTTLRYRQNWGP